MTNLLIAFSVLAGLLHVFFFMLESIWWQSRKVHLKFGYNEAEAETLKLFVFNQGFYNLFLGILNFVGCILTYKMNPLGLGILLASNLVMFGAGLVLLGSTKGQKAMAAMIQAVPPLAALTVLIIGLSK